MAESIASKGAKLVQEEIVREADRENNLKAQRMVSVRLAPTWPRALILNWNQGIVGTTIGQRTRRRLEPGNKTIISIDRAQVYFGMFTIPTDIEDVFEERNRLAMAAQFEQEKSRVQLLWGDFPRAASHLKDGNEPLGPCRFPDVFVTVTESSGDEWPEIRLRELYDFGEYYDAEPKPRAFVNPNANSKTDAATIAELQNEVAKLSALTSGILAGQRMTPTIPPAPEKKNA